MSRIPLRLRVAGAFTLAMAVVLAACGTLVYVLVARDLDASLDRDLRLRAQDVSALVTSGAGSLARAGSPGATERGESFAEVVDGSGAVLDSTPTLSGKPLLRAGQAEAGLKRSFFVDVSSAPGLDEPARLLVTPIRKGGRPVVLVVGDTRENRAETLASLRTDLYLAGPIALVLATLLGYLVAGSGLRVVETMRRKAAGVSAEQPGERLPVPRTGDELERLATTLNEMLDRLERAVERERSFVADAGHELRTPLALLRAELDFALQHAESEEQLRAALRTTSEETDRLVQLSADLLLIASAQSGRVELGREPLAARDVFESVRNRFFWRAAEARRAIEIDDPDGLRLEGDKLRLEQAVGNLVENALRYGEGAVCLQAVRRNGCVELHVRDRGGGFPEDFLPLAFERFSRPPESRSGEGAGLGLAMVSVIAQAHTGTTGIRNREGADVWIAIPDG